MAATSRTPAFAIAGFDHVDLWVTDLPSATRFFQEKLGLAALSSSDDHTFLILGDQVLGLRRAAPGVARSEVHHLAVRIGAFEGLREFAQGRGLVVRDERHRADSDSLFVEGPEGMSIELIHRPNPGPPQCATSGTTDAS